MSKADTLASGWWEMKADKPKWNEFFLWGAWIRWKFHRWFAFWDNLSFTKELVMGNCDSKVVLEGSSGSHQHQESYPPGTVNIHPELMAIWPVVDKISYIYLRQFQKCNSWVHTVHLFYVNSLGLCGEFEYPINFKYFYRSLSTVTDNLGGQPRLLSGFSIRFYIHLVNFVKRGEMYLISK